MHAQPEVSVLIESIRPSPSRLFDQIPMNIEDLLAQAERIHRSLADKEVVFIGDYDCASLAIAAQGLTSGQMPSRMLVVDFDERVLASIQDGFDQLGLAHLLETRSYNVFDPVPMQYAGLFDRFYANPPYGQFNQGESVWLFVHRGIEFCSQGATGSLIIPCDDRRAWTTANVFRLEQLVRSAGWQLSVADRKTHSYSLDDDPSLQSITFALTGITRFSAALPWSGRYVPQELMQTFYGRSVLPPFPTRIDLDGNYVYASEDRENQAS